ncbi:GNAT family N-acetyltransferase [Deinococcus aerophilus]|uniref:Hypothetical acetyltransferase, GNAT family protein n=1 Tax=Deinococcus aerophilus TaxID=522488 RepID=A0ABQ2GVP5_9DEIO|nr:GNAT family N-acetyltransferase [Deinococcus aerophilus]GGM15937.1 hypothetical acetyltransferase, GNAT family protein [Deinococcus aerophilus]
MNTELLGRLARAEAAAHARYGRTGETAHFGPLIAVHAGPELPINAAWHDGTRPPTAQELEAFGVFCAHHSQPQTVHLLSAFMPQGWTVLSERGYALDYVLHVYVHDLKRRPAAPPGDLREEEPAGWAAVAARGFGPGTEAIMDAVARAPGTRRFMAWLDGEPAAVAAMSMGEGVAAFHGTATLPPFRRRGVQTALLAHRLHVAAQAGADLASVFVTPGSGSERNVERAGFRLVGARLTVTRHPEALTRHA